MLANLFYKIILQLFQKKKHITLSSKIEINCKKKQSYARFIYLINIYEGPYYMPDTQYNMLIELK